MQFGGGFKLAAKNNRAISLARLATDVTGGLDLAKILCFRGILIAT